MKAINREEAIAYKGEKKLCRSRKAIACEARKLLTMKQERKSPR